MFMFKLFKSSSNNNLFYLNNYGNHKRDFTYINDVTFAIYKLIKKKSKVSQYLIFVQTNLLRYQILLSILKNNNAKIQLVKMYKAD